MLHFLASLFRRSREIEAKLMPTEADFGGKGEVEIETWSDGAGSLEASLAYSGLPDGSKVAVFCGEHQVTSLVVRGGFGKAYVDKPADGQGFDDSLARIGSEATFRVDGSTGAPIEGEAFLRMHAAIENFADGFAVLLVGLVQCDQPSSGCTELLTGQSGFAQVGFGSGFGEVEVYLGSIDHVVPAGKHLLVTVAVAPSSSHDVWLEFGSSDFPSQLLVS